MVSPLLRLNHRLRFCKASGLSITEKGIRKRTIFGHNRLATKAFSTASQLTFSPRQRRFDPFNCIVTAQDDGALKRERFAFAEISVGADETFAENSSNLR